MIVSFFKEMLILYKIIINVLNIDYYVKYLYHVYMKREHTFLFKLHKVSDDMLMKILYFQLRSFHRHL